MFADATIGWVFALATVAITIYWWISASSSSGTERKAQSIRHQANDPTNETPPVETATPKLKTRTTTAKPHTTKKFYNNSKKLKQPQHPRFQRRFGGHTGTISAMTVSPNGEWMATAGTDGVLRVSSTSTPNQHVQVKVSHPDYPTSFHDQIAAIAWCEDQRTLVCTTKRAQAVALYRIRKKKEQESNSNNNKFPYELIELSKRRFSFAEKLPANADDHVQVLVDRAHSHETLIVTASRSIPHGNVVVWNAEPCGAAVVATLTVGGGAVRWSPDGRFLCDRVQGAASQVKIFEVHRKKIKGQVEPVVDRVTSVMVLTCGKTVADVAFLASSSDTVVVGLETGGLQLWSLNVDYKNREDPKLLCCNGLLLQNQRIRLLAAATGDHNKDRVAAITNQGELHILSFGPTSVATQLSTAQLDVSISETHADGVGDLQLSGPVAYTRGAYSKDVFAWNIGADRSVD